MTRLFNVFLLITFITVLMNVTQAASYNVIDRYSLIEDRFKTEEMLRPYGHDFIFDVNVATSEGLQDLLDGAKTATKGATDQEKLTNAQTFLTAEKDNEHGVRVHVEFGVPIFSFTAWGVKIVPDFRFGANFGANLGIKTASLTANNILDLIGEDIPAAMKAQIQAEFDPVTKAGQNIITDTVCTAGGLNTLQCNVLKAQNYKYPSSTDFPDLFVFTKLDVKAGMLFNYLKNNWFGHLHFYGLHRTDYLIRVNADSLLKDDLLDGADNLNSQVSLNIDYKLGYRAGRYSIFGMIEELKITTVSDKIAEAGDLSYGNDALARVHGDAKFQYSAFSLTPFAGVHKRSHYDLADGMYAGADFGMYFWGDRLGLRFRTMWDPEHITLSPQFKLWLMQLEYAYKTPVTATLDDGTKVASYHSLNFRLFF